MENCDTHLIYIYIYLDT